MKIEIGQTVTVWWLSKNITPRQKEATILGAAPDGRWTVQFPGGEQDLTLSPDENNEFWPVELAPVVYEPAL